MKPPAPPCRLVISTAPDSETARRLADGLVSEGLAACVNLLPGATSVYRWQGETHRDAEVLMLAKTTAGREADLVAWIEREHPYDTPEAIVLPIEGGSTAYLGWVADTVGGS